MPRAATVKQRNGELTAVARSAYRSIAFYENRESHIRRRMFWAGKSFPKIERRSLDSRWLRGRDKG
jgi:hypothetical protein